MKSLCLKLLLVFMACTQTHADTPASTAYKVKLLKVGLNQYFYEVSYEKIEKYFQNLVLMLQDAKATPYKKNEKTSCSQLSNISPQGFFDILEFKDGDILCSFDGAAIYGFFHPLAKKKVGDHFVFTILRNHQELFLEYTITK